MSSGSVLWSEVIVKRTAYYLSLVSIGLVIAGVVLVIIYHSLYVGLPYGLVVTGYTLLTLGSVLMFILRFSRVILVSRTKWFVDNVVVERIVDREVDENRSVVVRIAVKPGRKGSPLEVVVRDNPPRHFSILEGGRVWSGLLYPGKCFRLEYTVEPLMGSHVFGSIDVEISDPLGLYKSILSIPQYSYVRVLPAIIVSPKDIVLNLESLVPGGLTLTHTPGVGVEYFFTREYRYGDDYRFIDWKATARTRSIMVKEFEREAFLNILFYMIITPSLYRGVRGCTELEYLSRIVSTLSNYLAYRGDNYALGYIVSTSKPTKCFTGYGRGYGHTYVVRKTLADIPWIENLRFHDILDDIVNDLYRCVRRDKTIVILLTDFNNNIVFTEGLVSRLRELLLKGHELIVILPDPILFTSESIRKHLTSIGREDLVEAMEKLYIEYHRFDRRIFDDIKGLLSRSGYKVVHTTPYKTVIEIARYIELLRRYYG